MSDEQNNCLITELYIDPAEMVPVKVSLRFIFDIIMQVFFSRQFSSLRFTLPGGLPGPGGERKWDTPIAKRQGPNPQRENAARGTLLGSKGHGFRSGQKAK